MQSIFVVVFTILCSICVAGGIYILLRGYGNRQSRNFYNIGAMIALAVAAFGATIENLAICLGSFGAAALISLVFLIKIFIETMFVRSG